MDLKSKNGTFLNGERLDEHARPLADGDTVEELDWSVGRVLEEVRAQGIEDRTIVVFTSDNGPWNALPTHHGVTGGLRGGKGDTFECGMRVPTICWWPGTIKPGVRDELFCLVDVLPTIAALADDAGQVDGALRERPEGEER